ncbi:DUF4041 domain-containing protein [Gloeobacter kilaueensis]|uniref:Recombination and DNA strand exchange inhibitor protein n=1 Tax=Gloeobacter kilaueensis (strain ATCC BAA-2537 / CCAP 1431/1 / ULC 316 / JS1) TaxID=1183438 RepID=U5QK18_GLOK1|nr:DUF4041 domain-containing protein [Gloeobacter kilaueensis]AGY57954.1 recombination and DNA strand exchange inhibitor protein [Gloeobacter kilaueensis JS1]
MNSIELLLSLSTALGAVLAGYSYYRGSQFKAKLARYSEIVDKEAYIAEIDDQADKRQRALQEQEAAVKREIEQKQQRLREQETAAAKAVDASTQEAKRIGQEIQTLKQDLAKLQELSFLEDYGFYERRFTYEDSGKYAQALNACRERQKQMLKDNRAALCETTWSIGNSEAEGQKMTRNILKLILRAFNGECDAAISRIKYNNIETMINRIEGSYKAINQMGQTLNFQIAPTYKQEKIQELQLAYEYQVVKQEEAEEQKRIREQMREEERAQREAEKARLEAEKEELRYQKALEEARRQLETATAAKQSKLLAQIDELSRQLEEAQKLKDRAQSLAQITRSGHVYIISNIGSFGENVYKIGMTRRLDPMDRVVELGDASVPFPFDVHAMIYTTNAPTLEKLLHTKFHRRRMNVINERKEFFKVSIEEIEAALNEAMQSNPDLKFKMQLTKVAEAEQYRQTQAQNRELVAA